CLSCIASHPVFSLFLLMLPRPQRLTLFPYTTLFRSPDIAEENIQKLKQLFPEVFTESKVDFEKLQQVLGEYVEDSNERYNFTWKDRKSTRLNSSHVKISYAVFCLKKKK